MVTQFNLTDLLWYLKLSPGEKSRVTAAPGHKLVGEGHQAGKTACLGTELLRY